MVGLHFFSDPGGSWWLLAKRTLRGQALGELMAVTVS